MLALGSQQPARATAVPVSWWLWHERHMMGWPSHGPSADAGLLSAACIQPRQLALLPVIDMKLPCDCVSMHWRYTLTGACSSCTCTWVQHWDVQWARH